MASLLAEPIPADQVQTELKKLDPAIGYALDEFKIPGDVQAKLANLGYIDLAVFASIEDEVGEVRKALRADLGLDPSKGPDHRNLLAKLVSAWRAAGTRFHARQKEEAFQRAQGLPKSMLASDHFGACERIHQSAWKEGYARE